MRFPWLAISFIVSACGGGAHEHDGGSCPSSIPSGGAPCVGSEQCEYGSESCCGNTYPSTVCQCQNGTYSCYATDACLVPACADGGVDGGGGDASMCPATQPASGATCSGTEQCSYGTETCCGNTYPSVVCQCQSGSFNCFYTDACLIPGCPDAGTDRAGEGEACGVSEADRDAGARACADGLVCCYPCGIPDCVDRCTTPCGEPGPGCQEDGCPGPFP